MPLGAKVRRLIELKRQPDGEEYPITEIARAASKLYREQKISQRIAELTAAGADQRDIESAVEAVRGEPDVLSRQFMSEIKDGKRPNPPFDKIVALSLFFGVTVDYFAVGAAVTEATKRAEDEVELYALTQQLASRLDTDSSGKGAELMGALMRGGLKMDPQQLAGMFRLQLAAMDQAQEEQTK
jgi:hypothetical protein